MSNVTWYQFDQTLAQALVEVAADQPAVQPLLDRWVASRLHDRLDHQLVAALLAVHLLQRPHVQLQDHSRQPLPAQFHDHSQLREPVQHHAHQLLQAEALMPVAVVAVAVDQTVASHVHQDSSTVAWECK